MKKFAIAFLGLFLACFVLECSNAEAFFGRRRRSRTTVRINRFDNTPRVSRREVRQELARQRALQRADFDESINIQIQERSSSNEQLLIPDAPLPRRSGCTGGRCVQNCR